MWYTGSAAATLLVVAFVYTGSAAATLLVVAFVFLGQSAAIQDLTSKWTTYISCMHKDFVRQVEYILAILHVAIPLWFPFPRVYCLWLHMCNTHKEDRADSVHIHKHIYLYIYYIYYILDIYIYILYIYWTQKSYIELGLRLVPIKLSFVQYILYWTVKHPILYIYIYMTDRDRQTDRQTETYICVYIFMVYIYIYMYI